MITGNRKNCNTGKLVAISLGGTEEDMKFVDRNPMFELYDADYVLDPGRFANNDKFVGINAAVAVDLNHQIAAESIGPGESSAGRRATPLCHRCPIVERRSLYHDLTIDSPRRKISHIVPALKEGSMVTVPRTLADFVVTEYGITT